MKTRTRLLTLLATLATLAVVLVGAGCGSDGGGGSSEDAQALLDRAYKKQIKSADVKFDIEAQLDGVEELKGPLKLTLEGPYKQDSPDEVPVLDWDITASGAGKEFSGGLIVTEDNAFVEYKGESYEVGTEIFSQFKQQTKEQQQSFTPQGLKAIGFDPTKWLKDPELKDGEDVGGDSTQLVTGDVDVRKVIEDFFDLLSSDAFKQQLQSQGQTVPDFSKPSEEDLEKIEGAIDELKFEANIDDQDRVRRTLIDGDFTIPEEANAGELKGGSVLFDFVLEEVDIDPSIEAPSNPKPLNELTEQLGLGALSSGGGTSPSVPAQPGAPPGGLQTP